MKWIPSNSLLSGLIWLRFGPLSDTLSLNATWVVRLKSKSDLVAPCGNMSGDTRPGTGRWLRHKGPLHHLAPEMLRQRPAI